MCVCSDKRRDECVSVGTHVSLCISLLSLKLVRREVFDALPHSYHTAYIEHAQTVACVLYSCVCM